MGVLGNKARFILLGLCGDRAISEEIITAIETAESSAGAVINDGSVPFAADQSMGSHKITNLTDPTSNQDAATKKYVDDHAGGTVDLSAYVSTGVVSIAAANKSTAGGYSSAATFKSGNASGSGTGTGDVTIQTGNSSAGPTGEVNIKTGTGTHTNQIEIHSGDANTTQSGDIQIYTGDGTTNSGTVYIFTGSPGSGSKGVVYIEYTPAISGNYSPAVSTMAAALDQLAARVKALEP